MSANMQSIQLSMVWTFFLILIKYTAINAPPPTTSSLWSFARSAQTFPPVFSFFHTILCQHRDSPFSGNRVTIGLQIGRLKRYPVAGSLLSCERSFELRTIIPMQSSVNKHNFLLRSSQPLEKADYVFTRNVTILIWCSHCTSNSSRLSSDLGGSQGAQLVLSNELCFWNWPSTDILSL